MTADDPVLSPISESEKREIIKDYETTCRAEAFDLSSRAQEVKRNVDFTMLTDTPALFTAVMELADIVSNLAAIVAGMGRGTTGE